MYDNDIYSNSNTNDSSSGRFSGTQSSQYYQDDKTTNNYSHYNYDTYYTNSGSFSNGFDVNTKEKKPKKGKFFKKVLVSVSLGLLFGAFAGVGFIAVQKGAESLGIEFGQEMITSQVQPEPSVIGSEEGIQLTNTNNIMFVESDVSDVVEEVMPAMVSITNNYIQTSSFWGQTYSQEQAANGSGIIVSENETELLIATNYHVVSDAVKLSITFIDGSEAEAKIKGMDSSMDLAVVAVPLDSLSEETKNAISIATLGNSDNLKLGEPVIAIGNALGYGQSVTNGIVSALNRELTLEDGSTGTFIQTNAAINPGNSGGALLNINGEVIGINSNKIASSQIEGMGYAIPISSANPIIADLMERQTRDKVAEEEGGYMGISLQEVTAQISQMYRMPQGIYVIEVEEGSAAEKAGLMQGDIITEFDGDNISSYADLENVLQYYAVGDSAKITIERPENGGYVEYVLDITLGKRPADTP